MQIASVKCAFVVSADEWDAMACRLGGGLFHSYAYTVYSARVSDSLPLFIQAYDSKGKCVGLASGYISKSRLWPFSRYCKQVFFPSLPVTNKEHAEHELILLTAVENELKRLGVSTLFISSYDSPNSERVLFTLDYQTEDRSEFIIDLMQGVDDLWKSFKGSRRTDVRFAEKANVVTRQLEIDAGLDLVCQFHIASMERRGIDVMHKTRKILLSKECLLEAGKAIILASFSDEKPLCAAIFGHFNNAAYYLVSGSGDEGNKNRAPVHMLWTAIQRFKEKGCTVFNMGGSTETEVGLYRFKKGFGGHIYTAPKGKKTISGFGAFLNSAHPKQFMRRS